MPLFPLYGPVPSQGAIPTAANLGAPAAAGAGAVPTTPGAPATGYSPAYGGVPQVPSLIDIYGQSTAANTAMLPGFTNIGGKVTAANEQELLNNLRMAIPGYDASVGQSMSNIGNLQRGQIPPDVLALLKQQSAERGISTGLYDSPNANAALLRSLGLTSLGLEGEGEKQMSDLVRRTPQAQPFDVSKLMMSPTDLYESNLLANLYKSAPVPKAAADQLLADQLGLYNIGRRNVPSYSSGLPALGAPYSPFSRTDIPGGGGPNWSNRTLSPTPTAVPTAGDINWSDVGAPQMWDPYTDQPAPIDLSQWPPAGIPGATTPDLSDTTDEYYLGGY